MAGRVAHRAADIDARTHPSPAHAGLDFDRERGHSRIRRPRRALIPQAPVRRPGFCVSGPMRAKWSWGRLLRSGCVGRLANGDRTLSTSARRGLVFFVWLAAHAWRVGSNPISGSLHAKCHGNPVSTTSRAARLTGQDRVDGLPGESVFVRPIRHRGALYVEPISCLLSGE